MAVVATAICGSTFGALIAAATIGAGLAIRHTGQRKSARCQQELETVRGGDGVVSSVRRGRRIGAADLVDVLAVGPDAFRIEHIEPGVAALPANDRGELAGPVELLATEQAVAGE